MSYTKNQLWDVFNANQSFLRLPVGTQFQIVNKIFKAYEAREKANDNEFFTLWRFKADNEYRRMDFEAALARGDRNLWCCLNGVLNKASMLASKELGEKGNVEHMAQGLAAHWGQA